MGKEQTGKPYLRVKRDVLCNCRSPCRLFLYFRCHCQIHRESILWANSPGQDSSLLILHVGTCLLLHRAAARSTMALVFPSLSATCSRHAAEHLSSSLDEGGWWQLPAMCGAVAVKGASSLSQGRGCGASAGFEVSMRVA